MFRIREQPTSSPARVKRRIGIAARPQAPNCARGAPSGRAPLAHLPQKPLGEVDRGPRDRHASTGITAEEPPRAHRIFSPSSLARTSPEATFTHFRTFAPSHFRTFALSHFRTFALSHSRTHALTHSRTPLP